MLLERILNRILLEGRGLPVADVYKLMFGPGEPADALKAMVDMIEDGAGWNQQMRPKMEELAAKFQPAYDAFKNSQEAKALMNDPGVGVEINWRGNTSLDFALNNFHKVKVIKRALQVRGTAGKTKGRGTPNLGSKKWLKQWKDTNGYRMPEPSREFIIDLEPHRLQERTVLYRGVRFREIADLLDFSEKYASGKRPFPFVQENPSAWTKDINIAKRFATMSSAGSEYEAMMQWASRAKSGKDYSEYGGYIIGAVVNPEDTIVDFENISISAQHGDEGEVIVKGNTPLTCKVYQTWGNVPLEIERFAQSFNRKERLDNLYFGDGLYDPTVSGDEESGTIKFKDLDPEYSRYRGRPSDPSLTPRSLDKINLDRAIKLLRGQLYDAAWIDDNTIEYKRRQGVNLPPKKK